MELFFQEGTILIKTLSTMEEMDAAFRLRHDIFVDELNWVPPSPDKREMDAYDKFAVPIGLFDTSAWRKTDDDNGSMRLIGYVRLIQSDYPFMIEKEFASLLPNGKTCDTHLKKLSSIVESTRICVKRERRIDKIGSMGLTIGHLLYKAIYNWCLIHNIRFLATIIEKRYYRHLKSIFPFEPLGDFMPMGEGVLTGIVLLDWRNFELVSREKKQDFVKWMTTNIQVPRPSYAHVPS